ncbi:MAG TPA: hypothetical protein VFC82_03880 [Actinomycetaceae bacterium]|nr:hypothetical protein [Actinomycetaceae bacterium]
MTREVRPHEVPGYFEARAAGLLPEVRQVPPALTVRPTSRAAFAPVPWLAISIIFLPLALDRLLAQVIPEWMAVPVMLATALALATGVAVQLRRVGRQSLAEFRRGYTTLPFTIGTPWFSLKPGGWLTGFRIGWDHRTHWHLDGRTGVPVAAPTVAGDPPGLYPSPHRPGAFELWTGSEWTRHYDTPDAL